MTFRPARRPVEATRFLHFLGKNRFESARKLQNVRSPVLIAHGDPDHTIPTAEARLLFAAANEPKRLLIVPGAGHVVFGAAGEQYLIQVEQFMRDAITGRGDRNRYCVTVNCCDGASD